MTLSGQLECLAMSVESGLSAFKSNMERPSFEARMRKHRILSEKWDEVVDKTRQVDGFTDFLRAVPFTTLQNAAAEGPIIIINISQYRSDAIILQRCRRSCHCSPTENFTNNSCSVVLLVCGSLRFTRQGFCETNFVDIEKPLG